MKKFFLIVATGIFLPYLAQAQMSVTGKKADGSPTGPGDRGVEFKFKDETSGSNATSGSISGHTPGSGHVEGTSAGTRTVPGPAVEIPPLPAGIDPPRNSGTLRRHGPPPNDRERQQDALNKAALQAYSDYETVFSDYKAHKATAKEVGKALQKKRDAEDAANAFMP